MHFRGNHIVEDGKFLSFGCGMRGVLELGLFDINSPDDTREYSEIVTHENFLSDFEANVKSNQHHDRLTGFNDLDENCYGKCFVDWTSIDLIINHKITYTAAEKWFVLFRDPNIKNFILNYK